MKQATGHRWYNFYGAFVGKAPKQSQVSLDDIFLRNSKLFESFRLFSNLRWDMISVYEPQWSILEFIELAWMMMLKFERLLGNKNQYLHYAQATCLQDMSAPTLTVVRLKKKGTICAKIIGIYALNSTAILRQPYVTIRPSCSCVNKQEGLSSSLWGGVSSMQAWKTWTCNITTSLWGNPLDIRWRSPLVGELILE